MTDHADHPSLSRRQVLTAAGGAGLLTAAGAGVLGAAPRALAATTPSAGDGTPEQVHLTWGDDPATSVVVSWASPGPADRPRVRVDGHATVPAVRRTYTDGINGETVWTYHARLGGLRPGASYSYTVTADNDAHAAQPFAGTFRTAPQGRAGFRFTSLARRMNAPGLAGPGARRQSGPGLISRPVRSALIRSAPGRSGPGHSATGPC